MVGTLASPALSLTPHGNRSRPGRCGPAAGVGWLLHIVLLCGALMANSAGGPAHGHAGWVQHGLH